MKIIDSLAALAKVILQSGKPFSKGERKEKALIIMGNGPSLRQTIDDHGKWLESHPLMAVNFAANTPEFFRLKPEYYILADPHFFTGHERDANVVRLWQNIAGADWSMTLFIPLKEKKNVENALIKAGCSLGKGITLKYYNLTPGDGASWLLCKLYDLGLAMPRPRNVLIPAIMTALREGFRKVIITGADHTWTRTLEVDDDNHVVSVQPHFYKDSGEEKKRVATDYKGLRICDVLGSMTIAFRSYHHIKEYAGKRGIEILNATPGSFIDAFPRIKAV